MAALAPQFASADTTSGTVTGTVTNSASQGIAGVTVEFTEVNTGGFYYTSTASDGTYTDAGLPAGSYQVLFLPAGGQDYLYQFYPDKSNSAAAQPVAVTAGQTTAHVDATLATGATISGNVTAAAGGAAVSGVSVYVREYGGGYPDNVRMTNATTDSNGNWSVTGLPSGLYQVEFNPYNSDLASQDFNDVTGQDVPTPITLTAGSTTSNVDAALKPAGQITGTVTDGTTGKPAAGVIVAALDPSGNQYAWTTTDANGNYTLSHLNASASYRVQFSPSQRSALESEFYPSGATLQAAAPVAVTVGQTTPNIDETLGEGGSISGMVSDAATGYPLGGAKILVTDDAGNPIYSNYNSTTHPDGSYEVTNLAPGSYKVEFGSVGALGFQYYQDARTLSTATPVTVGAGQAVSNIDAALTQGGTIEGTVKDAVTGQGFADAYLEVLDAAGNYVSYGYTNASGRYEIPGIAPGTYYLQVDGYYNYLDQVRFYGGSSTLAGATPVTVAAGATTSGIDISLSPQSVPSPGVSTQSAGTPTVTTTTTSTTPVPPAGHAAGAIAGPPRLFGGSLSGLGKDKAVLKFRLVSGSNGGHKLRSFKVKLPAGLSFVAAQLAKGVKVSGGGKVTEKLTGGQLVVTLFSPSKALIVSISAPALRVSGQLSAKAAKHKAGTLRVTVTVSPVNQAGRMLTLTVKNPR